MILAEKIMDLRKKMGWSQEELAEQLGVSRQSVSKWESAQSLPDMDKIVKMSSVFTVSTDYLLKDELTELGDRVPRVEQEDTGLRRVSMEEASRYMEIRTNSARSIALSTMLCVASPIVMLFLIALSESPYVKISENAAVGTGLCVLIIMVALGVMGFIRTSSAASDFAFLEKEAFETEYGVSGVVKKRKEEFKERYTRINTISTVLCICSVIPLFISICFNAPDFVFVMDVCFILLMVAVACYGYVAAGTVMGCYDKLLEEGDYSRAEKSRTPLAAGFNAIYWLAVTALFLVFQFIVPGGWAESWKIWPVAGILFAILRIIISLVRKK
ncbi:MAG: helix-turn-helix domain-containing protein [bacterium]|nr:helix-turn-helix domain-containing protein [bacterium]